MSGNSNVFIKCRCGHTWKESMDNFDKDIAVTANTIDQIRLRVNYKCEKCGREESASMYLR